MIAPMRAGKRLLSVAAALAATAALLAPRAAEAGERVDPLVGMGGVLLGAATFGVGLGAPLSISWAPKPREVCGINGCISASRAYRDDNNFPSIMLGAGIGSLAVAIPTLIVGVAGHTPAVGARRSEARMNFGVWLIGVGSALAGAGAGAVVHGQGESASSRALGKPLGVTGGALVAVGVPFLVTGAMRAREPPFEPLKLRSSAAMYVGMTLTTLAVPTLAGGAVLAPQGDYGAAFGGGMLLLGGGLLSGGIAAWASGAREIPVAEAATAALSSVRVSPGFIGFEGTF